MGKREFLSVFLLVNDEYVNKSEILRLKKKLRLSNTHIREAICRRSWKKAFRRELFEQKHKKNWDEGIVDCVTVSWCAMWRNPLRQFPGNL